MADGDISEALAHERGLRVRLLLRDLEAPQPEEVVALDLRVQQGRRVRFVSLPFEYYFNIVPNILPTIPISFLNIVLAFLNTI